MKSTTKATTRNGMMKMDRARVAGSTLSSGSTTGPLCYLSRSGEMTGGGSTVDGKPCCRAGLRQLVSRQATKQAGQCRLGKRHEVVEVGHTGSPQAVGGA